MFNCDPVSIIAWMGIPSHSIDSLINSPRVFVLNDVANPTGADTCDLILIESASNVDNSRETPIISPTANSTLVFRTWSSTLNGFTWADTADLRGTFFSTDFSSAAKFG